MGGIWFSPLVDNWTEADINANLQLFVKKGQSLGRKKQIFPFHADFNVYCVIRKTDNYIVIRNNLHDKLTIRNN